MVSSYSTTSQHHGVSLLNTAPQSFFQRCPIEARHSAGFYSSQAPWQLVPLINITLTKAEALNRVKSCYSVEVELKSAESLALMPPDREKLVYM